MRPWQHAMPLSRLANALFTPFDVFICSASFEERCKSIPSAVAGKVPIKRSFVCFNRELSPIVTKNTRYLVNRLGPGTLSVPLDRSDPIESADMLQKVFLDSDDQGGPQTYLVDITTFTHEALLILLKILQPRLVRKSKATLVYAPAAEYAVGLKNEEKWLSRGIKDIRSVLGYPGSMKASRKSHLIVLVGFESDRAERLIDEYGPNIVSLGFGAQGSATAAGHEAVNRRSLEVVASKFQNCAQFDFSCVDIALAEQAVTQQISKFPDHNVIVAPMNTKISTVGVAGAAFRNEEVQVCYARALRYNTIGYSKPGKDCIVISMPRSFWTCSNSTKLKPAKG